MSRAVPGDAPLVLDLDGLEEGSNSCVVDVDAAQLDLLDLEYAFPGAIHVRAHVARALETFDLEADVRATVTGDCCRCLTAVEQPLTANLRQLLQRKSAGADELEAAAEEDDVVLLSPGTRYYDLSPVLRDAIVLELPMRLYCALDCRGLCPHCGSNLNEGECGCSQDDVDPRWAALSKLQFT